MAETYREITASEVDARSPLTTQLADAWRANVLAMFEQAAGAPRYQPKLLSFSQGVTVAGTTTVINLSDGYETLMFNFVLQSASGAGATVDMSLSDDGGSTWGSSVRIADNASAAVERAGSAVIDASTGVYRTQYAGPASNFSNGTLTPNPADAVRFFVSSASGASGGAFSVIGQYYGATT